MPDFFPRHSIAWKVEEPAALRALTLSVLEIGVLTGVVLRLVRALALTYGPAGSLTFIVVLEIGLALARFGAAAAHLGNFPLRNWAWRVPVFALVVVGAQMATSLLLIAAHRERIGSVRADWDDWPSMALRALVWQTLSLCIFALLLAAVVQYVRAVLLRREQRTSAVEAIHESRAR